MRKRIMVVDDFYPDPGAVRRVATRRKFFQPEGITGWRTRPYYPRGVRRRIERRFGVEIAEWHSDPEAVAFANGVFFSAFSKGRRAEAVGVHADDPRSWITLLVYLTPDAPSDAGTSFWRHRETGLTTWPTQKDALRLGVELDELEERLEADATKKTKWEEIDRVGNVYNRAVFYPGGMLHSATRHFGSDLRSGRLYQLFHFPVK